MFRAPRERRGGPNTLQRQVTISLEVDARVAIAKTVVQPSHRCNNTMEQMRSGATLLRTWLRHGSKVRRGTKV